MAGGGGTEPNLTPFIDLFSVLICFLLMTAAWLNLETFPVQIEKDKSSSNSQETPPSEEPPKDDSKKISLSFTLMQEKILAKEGENEILIPHLMNNEINSIKIEELLTVWRQKFPNKKDLILNTEAKVTYGQMIGFYDLLIALDWPDVGINPN